MAQQIGKAGASKNVPRPTGGRIPRKPPASSSTAQWNLRLYVAGVTPRSLRALSNLKTICEEHLKGVYTIEVIDLLKTPQLAQSDDILAVPTLVRKLPKPVRTIIGDLSNEERVLVGLDLRPASAG